jgi:hypothetical protein
MSGKHTPVKKSSVVRVSSWVKQLSVDKIVSLTSLKVSGYFSGNFSDNLSENFSEYFMHILTKKSGKIFINFENIFLGGLRRHLQYQFPHSKFVKFYVIWANFVHCSAEEFAESGKFRPKIERNSPEIFGAKLNCAGSPISGEKKITVNN